MFPSSRHPDRTRQPAHHVLALQPLKQPSKSPTPSCHPRTGLTILSGPRACSLPYGKPTFPLKGEESSGNSASCLHMPGSPAYAPPMHLQNLSWNFTFRKLPGEWQVLQALCPRHTSPSAGNVLPATDLGHCPQWCPHHDPQSPHFIR